MVSEGEIGLRIEHGRQWSACTLMGPGRSRNADAVAVDFSGECLGFLVADGVGSMEGSPAASMLAVNAAADWIVKRQSVGLDEMESLFAYVNRSVGAGLRERNVAGATTLVAAVVAGGRAIVAAVGDSEALAVDVSGPARRLNPVDHLPARPNMLLAWIDGETIFEPHVLPLDGLPLRLCLVTDGVASSLSCEEIADIVRAVPPSEAARHLVDRARSAGSRDDASAVVISDRIEEELTPGIVRAFAGRRHRTES